MLTNFLLEIVSFFTFLILGRIMKGAHMLGVRVLFFVFNMLTVAVDFDLINTEAHVTRMIMPKLFFIH